MDREFKQKIMRLVKKALSKGDLLILSTREGIMVYGDEPDLVKGMVALNKKIYDNVSEKEIFRKMIHASVAEDVEGIEILEECLKDVKKRIERSEDNE